MTESGLNFLNKQFRLAVVVLLLLQIISCSAVQKYLDRKGMEASCEDIIKEYRSSDPDKFSAFLKNFSVEKDTAPFDAGTPEVRPIGKWKLDFNGSENLIQEKLFFNTKLSGLTYPDDKLVLYVYRGGDIKGKRVLLFVPGMGVSDFALRFIDTFFESIISHGYILAVYVPPYHLERIPAGGESGAGLFSYDSIRNIKMIAGCTSELRSAVKYFRERGASDISGWGGSMGGSFLLLSGEYERYSHITVMIPVLDWNSLLLDSPYLCKLRELLLNDGYSLDDVRNGYNLVSPLYTDVHIKPENLMIMFAEYDQLTSMKILNEYRLKHNGAPARIYRRSHSTILSDSGIYRDYDAQLELWGDIHNKK